MEIKGPYAPGAPTDPGPGYEVHDVNIRGLIQFAFWMAVVLAVTLFGMRWTFHYFSRTEPLGPTASPMVNEGERILPPSPRLQAQPHGELEDYCSLQQQNVNGYAWVNQQSGVVRIPVDRAMNLVLERGLPARSTAEAPGGSLPANASLVTVPEGTDVLGQCGYLTDKPAVEKTESSESK